MDNASTHKQFVQKVGSWSEKEVECWITEKLTSDEDQVKFHNYCQGIKHKPGTKKYQAALLRFVREHSLRDLALVEAAEKSPEALSCQQISPDQKHTWSI